jgi:hypothetical protein
MRQADEEGEGATHLADHTQPDPAIGQQAYWTQGTALAGQKIDQHRGDDTAQEHHLSDIDVIGEQLDDRIVECEPGHRQGHEQRAAQIGGKGHVISGTGRQESLARASP